MKQLLGTRIDDISQEEIQNKLNEFLVSECRHLIVTANPEMLVDASRDPEFQKILNMSSLTVADGFGLLFASFFIGDVITHRTTGNELMGMLCGLAQIHNNKIYMLGAQGDQAKHAAQTLLDSFDSLRIRWHEGGKIEKQNGTWQEDTMLLKDIQSFAPDILLVALGHKKQEMWISDHLAYLPSVRIAVGIGGAFAFLSGSIPRAPRVMRKIGLEWLWRLIQEPRRLGRIIRAVFVFPALVIWDRIVKTKR